MQTRGKVPEDERRFVVEVMDVLPVGSRGGGVESRNEKGNAGSRSFNGCGLGLHLVLLVLQEVAFVIATALWFFLGRGMHRAAGGGPGVAAFRPGKKRRVLQFVAAIVLVDQQSGRTE